MRYIVFVFALFATVSVWSQKLPFVCRGTVENSDLGKREAGVTVTIVQNGSTVSTTSTASSGKFKISTDVDMSSSFELKFTKNGLVGKKLFFDFSKMNEEDVPPGGDYLPPLDITLFKERENVDFSFLETEPIGKFDWNTRELIPRLDAVQAAQMKERVQKLLDGADKEKAEAEKKYNEAIAKADAFYNENKYEEALGKYEEALGYKPKEQYPADRIIELDALIAAQQKADLEEKQANQEYYNLIEAADNLREQDNLEGAISKYNEALTKKDEQYPKDQVAELSKILEDRKKEAENQAKYDAAIKQADGFLKQKSLKAARDKYQEASELKPSEQYPKDQLAKLQSDLEKAAEAEELQKKYDAAVAAGDELFGAEKYEEAKEKYNEALTVEASSTYVKGRIALCDEKLAAAKAEKERLEKIQELLTRGNEEMSKEDWDLAKATFTEVLGLEEAHPEATEKLAIIDQKIQEANDLALQEEKYNALMKEGDNADASNDLDLALGKYEEAKTIKDTEEVTAKITDVKNRIAERDAEAEKETAYANHMSEGESMMGIIGDLEGARAEYEKALALFPDREEPKNKIAEIDDLLAAQKSNQEKKEAYEAAIAEADGLFNDEKLAEAKAKYQEAAGIDDTQAYPGERITEIDALIAAQEDAQAKKEAYEAAIAEADGLFNDEKLAEAKAKYQEAAGIDDTQAYPGERITEIDSLIAAQEDAQAKKEAYEAAITEADGLFNDEKLSEAKSKYEEAAGIDDTQTYPGERIAEIDALIAAEQDAQAKKDAYEAAIAAADELFTNNNLEEAKSKYSEAQSIDSEQTYPAEKIAEINQLMADNQAAEEKKASYDAAISAADALYNDGNWEAAKGKYQEALVFDATQSYPGERISEIDKLLEDQAAANERKAGYDAAIESANTLFNEAKWEEAKAKYREALTFDDTQSYPNERISEIDQLISDQAAESELKERLTTLLEEGNKFYNEANLEAAKTKFEEVLSLDAGNSEATNMLNRINEDVAAQKSEAEKDALFNSLKEEGFSLAESESYVPAKQKLQEALTLKDDAEVRTKIDEINSAIARLEAEQGADAQYNSLMSEAQTLESSEDYRAAITKYTEASSIKPDESLPKTKISELEDLLVNLEAEKAKDAEYMAFMKKGDDLVAQEKYLDAIKEYNNALAVKPNEQEPVDKAAEARRLSESAASQDVDRQYEKILTVAQKKIDAAEYNKAIELLERAIKLKERDERPKEMLANVKNIMKADAEYKAFMDEGNALANSRNYEDAKAKYEQALSRKPTASEPVEKIAEMDRLIADLASNAQKDALYNEYMSKGNISQNAKSYEQALSEYQNALSVKPGDVNAQNKIDEVQQILDDLANTNAENLERQNKFNALLKEADEQFSFENYLPAKTKYEEALKVDPTSTYAKTQIDECVRLERLKSIQEAEREYRKIIDAADKNFNRETYDKAKDYYQRALRIKNDDPYPKQKLAEIEAILNPVMVESAELEDLGDPFDNSIMDGAALLAKAEEERKQLSGTQIDRTYDAIKDEASEMTAEKTQDHYDNTASIYGVYRQVQIESAESDLNREETIEALRIAERELADAEKRNMLVEHSENLGDQVVLDQVDKEVAIDFGVRDAVHMKNADLMETYNRSLADDISADIYSDYGDNIDTDQSITDVRIKVSENFQDDREERELVERDVVRARDYAINKNVELSGDRYEIQLANKGTVAEITEGVSTKSVEDAKIAKDNNVELVEIRNVVLDADREQAAVEQETVYKADEEMAAVKRRVISDQQDLDNNRLESNEVLKESKKELADAERIKYNAETEKYLQNKQGINENIAVNGEINEIAEEAHAQKIAYVNAMDKKAHIKGQEEIEGDREERLNSKQSIERVYYGVSENAVEESKKKEQNAATLAEVNKTINAQERANALGEQDKHYDAAGKIADIDNTPEKKVKVANALGEEYPEGVSEESFTKSDQNGLMTTIITRRVVVIDGHADVYVRTQTLNGITYSKNGKPSLSHVWSKETQDPSLERHY